MIAIDVHGIPAPQGSKRHVGHGVMVESSKAVKPWREAVRSQVQAAIEKGARLPLPAGAGVSVTITFRVPRPKSHYRTGRNAGTLRGDAPQYVAKRPDLDKLIRSTLDGLKTGGAYADDSQVVSIFATKRYTDALPPGALITIGRVV